MTNVNKKKEIPLVFAVDDNYAPFLSVAIRSIMDNASTEYFYKIFILNTGLSAENMKKLVKIAEELSDDVSLESVNVASRMDRLGGKTHLRDYYTNAIYYRIFIPSILSKYDKILYVDCDVVFLDDVSKLFEIDLGDNIFAAVHEEAMSSYDAFASYAEDFLDVPRMEYFNSGLLLINTKEYIKADVENKFIELMLKCKFEVAPDQDYLNVVCKGRVKYLDIGWNKTPIPDKEFDDGEVKLIHYKLNFKPWHYDDVRYQDAFWRYAKETPYYETLMSMRDGYTQEDKQKDNEAFLNLQLMARAYTESEHNYKKLCLSGFFDKKVN